MGIPLTEITLVRASWEERLADDCAHDWPDELGPDTKCTRCHLSYSEFEVRS